MNKINHFFNNLYYKIKNTSYTKITLPYAVLLGSILISLSIILSGFIVRGYVLQNSNTTSSNDPILFAGRSIDDTDYIEGNTKSNVIVMEYSDPECPYCVSLHPSMKQLRQEFANKVSFVYRHFPLTQIHQHAFDESRAIACAGIVGGTKKYYEYIDSIYGYQVDHSTNTLPVTGIEDIAKGVGLNMQAFTECMNTNQTAGLVADSISDGIKAGVQGTPATFILIKTKNGYEVSSYVNGARPYAYIKAAIEEALSK